VPTFAAVVLIVVAGLIALAGLWIAVSVIVRQRSTSMRMRTVADADSPQ